MTLTSIKEFFQQHKSYIAFLTVVGPAVAWTANFFEDEIKSEIKDREAKVELSTNGAQVELNKKIDFEARIDSVGRDELVPGILSIQADPQYIAITPSRNVNVGAVSGSQTVKKLPEATAIKLTNTLPNKIVKISARYTSGEVTAISNDLYIEIINPTIALRPHFDRSDTSRINLTGDWKIELGGIGGTMTIRQGTDNNINGSYSVPGSVWPAGAVTGHKDGKTFRAQFSVPGKESTETIRVAGYFDLTPPKGESIELEGCAYHLRTSPLTYNEGGAEGVECDVSSAFYDYWEVINAVRFYAKAPFDKSE